MDWMTLVAQIFEIIIFPLLSIGTIYLINLIKVKIQELKQKKDDDLYRRKWGKGHVLGTQSFVCLKKQ